MDDTPPSLLQTHLIPFIERAYQGFFHTWRTSTLFRILLILNVILIPYLWTIHKPPPWRAALMAATLLPLTALLLARGIEHLADGNPALARAQAASALMMTLFSTAFLWFFMQS